MSYIDYLNGEEWKQKREERIKKDNNTCRMCGKTTDAQVHHKTYVNIGAEDIDNDLITLCKTCHKKLHEVQNKWKPEADRIRKEYQEVARTITREAYEHWADAAAEIIARATLETGCLAKNIATVSSMIKDNLKLHSSGCGPVYHYEEMPYSQAAKLIAKKRKEGKG